MEPSRAPAPASTTCRLCGGPAGPSEECPRCEARLNSYLAGLVEELDASEEIAAEPGDLETIASTPGAPPPEPVALEGTASEHEPETSRPQSSAPPRPRRGRRLLIAAVALGALATAGSLAVSQGDPGGSAPADPREQAVPEPPAPAAPSNPPAQGDQPTTPSNPSAQGNGPVRFGNWSGEARVEYEDGTTSEMTVSMRVGPMERGERVGTATTFQNGTECRGSLRSLGLVEGVFRFLYRERNTAECVGTSRIKLTPRGEDRLAYEEVTDISVNRGVLTRD